MLLDLRLLLLGWMVIVKVCSRVRVLFIEIFEDLVII